jgi:hypothetical protein
MASLSLLPHNNLSLSTIHDNKQVLHRCILTITTAIRQMIYVDEVKQSLEDY